MLLDVKTVQASAFRTLVEALKEILVEANFEFDKTGIRVMAMDSSHTVLVYVKLVAANFETYACNQERVIVGINMTNLYKLIKTMGNNDTLCLFIEESNPNLLGIKIDNTDKNSTTKYKLNLLDLDDTTITVPKTTFSSVLTMPSADFQKHIRDMANLSDTLEIKSIGSKLMLSCKGDFASQETVIGETSNGMSFVKNDEPGSIVQGLFSLRHLLLFTKCTNLSNNIQIFLKNDYPLIINYGVASLGEIRLCLSPKIHE